MKRILSRILFRAAHRLQEWALQIDSEVIEFPINAGGVESRHATAQEGRRRVGKALPVTADALSHTGQPCAHRAGVAPGPAPSYADECEMIRSQQLNDPFLCAHGFSVGNCDICFPTVASELRRRPAPPPPPRQNDESYPGGKPLFNVEPQSKVAPISTPYKRKRERMLRALQPSPPDAA